MIALCVDDEALLLDTLKWAVKQSPDIGEIAAFDDEWDALEWAEKNRPDIAFLDIRMHGMDGLELAERLRTLHPGLPVVFCTGHREYAYDALQLHASGYLMKPIKPDAVQREIDHIKGGAPAKKPLLRAQCFGTFEVFDSTGRPLHFQRTKTKEMLAYLIDRRGSCVRSRDLCALLWEDSTEESRTLNYMHQLLADLRKRLREAGAEEVLRTQTQGYSIDPDTIDCDYYRFLDGDPDAERHFMGEYMNCYSWGEYTASFLISKMK